MTKRRVTILAILVALALIGWAWLQVIDRGAAADLGRLADRVADKNAEALKREAQALAKKYDSLRPLMHLFKKRTAKDGGLGFGKEAGVFQPDSIEEKIKSLAKTAPSSSELEQQSDALVRMTQVTIAVAEVAKNKCEVDKKVGYLDPADWARWSEDMQQSSRDLAEAVADRDGLRVQAAAAKLSLSCKNCHRIFRE
jgi:hypothetical protein